MTGKKKKNNPLFAFFGTPRFAVVVLDALEAHGLLPALVITAPDKPAGRGQKLTPAPAKVWALGRGIDVLTPATLKDDPPAGGVVAELGNTDWDVFVVAAYGLLIPNKILDIPRRGALNVHPSLLPKFRGASPVLSAILADERTTGTTIMQVAEKMDAGPVVAQARVEIAPEDWPPKGSVLEDMLAQEGGNLLAEVMGPWVLGEITPEPQDEAGVTFTKKFTDQDALIDLNADPHQNLLKIRAFDTNPRAYFVEPSAKLGVNKRIIITEAELKDGQLEILKVIPEGKKEVDFKTYRASRG
ncbi:MAG: methionyl-tRNA formyltransferase [Candidatus Adlerbacteria bacterium]|nr:methionyl-tRNA formyltransferase [Candidatus Adlerbacteria bacterium]